MSLVRILLCVSSTWFACEAQIATASDSSKNETLLLRATTDQIPESLVRLVADAGSDRFEQAFFPEMSHMTLEEVAAANCGVLQTGYLDEVQRRNNQQIPTSGTLGPLAYEVEWPVCLYVQRASNEKPLEYFVSEGDTRSEIYSDLTGALPDPNAISAFFETTQIDDLGLGYLQVPYYTVATSLNPNSLPADFLDAIEQYSAGDLSWGYGNDDTAYGRIIVAEEGRTLALPDSTCKGDRSNYPFDADLLLSMYEHMTPVEPGPKFERTRMLVVDNGFLGTAVSGVAIEYNDRFPKRVFMPDTFGELGPRAHPRLAPIGHFNRQDAAAPDSVRGHGTHVAGLMFGGVTFQSQFANLFENDFSWLKMIVVNIGNGGEILPHGAELWIQTAFNEIPRARTPHIVNFSVGFEVDPNNKNSMRAGRTIISALESSGFHDTLFVAAAGNNGSDLSSKKLYPALLGGNQSKRSPQVITVASHDSNNQLSIFSNRSGISVDLAAPGCKAASWLDHSRKIRLLSGTSQAAPIVSFTAGLLRTLWPATGGELKDRLIYSGDLLPNKRDRLQVAGKVKLNPVKALAVHQDYVSYYDTETQRTRTVLGKIETPISPITCSDRGTTEVPWATIRALKQVDGQFYAYRDGGQDSMLDICQAEIPPTQENNPNGFLFRLEAEVVGSKIVPRVPSAIEVTTQTIKDVTKRTRLGS